MTATAARTAIGETERGGYPALSPTFAWTHAILGVLFVAGVSVDLWAHSNIRPLFETFFTPWHGLLYGGFAIMATFLALSAGRHLAEGYPLRRALPSGYGLALVGAVIFTVGGIFDLVWHTMFGIEADFDALVSPSHLILLTGATLAVTATLRADAADKRAGLRVALAAFSTITLLLPFFDFFVGPFSTRTGTAPTGPRDPVQPMQVLAALTYTGIVVGTFLYAMRSSPWSPPLGSGLLAVGGSAVVMAIVRTRDLGLERDVYLGIAIVAGILADVLLVALKPEHTRPQAIRLFALALPIAILIPYFIGIALTMRMTWSVHASLGMIALCAAAGGLLGLLATPPVAGDERRG